MKTQCMLLSVYLKSPLHFATGLHLRLPRSKQSGLYIDAIWHIFSSCMLCLWKDCEVHTRMLCPAISSHHQHWIDDFLIDLDTAAKLRCCHHLCDWMGNCRCHLANHISRYARSY